jgi:hypothetical protein
MNENDLRDCFAMFAVLARAFHDKEADAKWCYEVADAMVEARSKESEQESGIAAFKPKRNTAKKVPNAK